MLKLAFIEKSQVKRGSAYKYIEMFNRIAEVTHVRIEKNMSFKEYDGIIVRGDKSDFYKIALKHNLPYILIANDIHSMRSGEYVPGEKESLEQAVSVLFPADEFSKYCHAHYNIKHSEIVYLKPLLKDIQFEPLPKLSPKDIVYAGNYLGRQHEDLPFSYRYNLPIFKKLINIGYTIHLYPSHPRVISNSEYRKAGCIPHEGVDNADLYRELSQYAFGLQVFADTHVESSRSYVQEYAIPNKAWEYLGAGLLALGINGGLAPKYYEGKWGHNVTLEEASPAGIQRGIDYMLTLPITDEVRYAEVMDNDLDKFEQLVSKIVR